MVALRSTAPRVFSSDDDSGVDTHTTTISSTRPKRASTIYKRPVIDFSSDEESLEYDHDEIVTKRRTNIEKIGAESGSRFIIDKIEVIVPLKSLSIQYKAYDDDDFTNYSPTTRYQPTRDENNKIQIQGTPLKTGLISSFFRPVASIVQRTASVSASSRLTSRKRKHSQSDDDFEASNDEEQYISAISSLVASPSPSALVISEDEETIVPKAKRPRLARKKSSTRRKPLSNNISAEKVVAGKWHAETSNKLPPISSIPDMFSDIVVRTPQLVDVARHLNGKPIRIATMCSGTESPLLALGMVSRFMKKQYNATLNIEHVFSCEIEPFKQAYIERNFKPPILFRDVRELGNVEATTAYGAKVLVPGNCDMLVAGTSCVDFSALNGRKKTLADEGESGQTFRGMLAWVDNHRPKIVILENVCGAPWHDVAEFFRKRGYSAIHGLFDTKNYYVPHTRTRGYLIAVDEKNSDKPEEWLELVRDMRRPASVTLEDFLLDPDDPRVHEARQKLIRDEIVADKRNEWTACENRHARERYNLEVGRGRPLTKWQEEGKCTLPDFAWSDWGNSQVDRVCDLLDILYLKNARRGVDMCYKTQMINVSQNVDRNPESTKTGICSCLTPKAIPYLTQRGGPLIGLEALSLQGLPVDQLLLTRESEMNLLDLAGNAMSSTVVGTAIVAALVAAKDLLSSGPPSNSDIDIEMSHNTEDLMRSIVDEESLKPCDLGLSIARDVSIRYLTDVADQSSRKCYCEGQSGVTNNVIQKCQDCGCVTCEKCGKNPVHNYAMDSSDRMHPIDFEKEVKTALPMVLTVNGVDAPALEGLRNQISTTIPQTTWELWKTMTLKAFSSHFRFSTLKRQETWTVFYVTSDARLELHLDPIQPEWRLYAVVPATEPGDSPKRQLADEPIARARYKSDAASVLECQWTVCIPAITMAALSIQGQGELVNSWEKNLGLQNTEAVDKMVWSKLVIEFVDPANKDFFDHDFTGSWTLLPDCGTATRALHKKDGSNPPVFLFLDPTTTGDVKDDGLIFSVSPRRYQFREKRPVLGKMDPSWRPSAINQADRVDCTFDGRWMEIPAVQFTTSFDFANEDTFAFANSTSLSTNKSCHDAVAFLSCKARIGKDALAMWPRQWNIVDQIHAQETFESLTWLTEKIMSENNMGEWTMLELPQISSTQCQICSPSPPDLCWRMKDRKMVPTEDPEQAGLYENALKRRPLPWVDALCLDINNDLNLKIGLNLTTLAHRALSLLPRYQGELAPTVQWRIVTDYVQPPRIVFPPFTIKSNKHDQPNIQPPHFLQNLRPEQLRSLRWMLSQESTSEPFIEEEISEAYHEHMKWRADVKAQRINLARGGILADEVGYGKTAITLGLLDCTQAQYEMSSSASSSIDGRIPIKATLIVVPPHLPRQWVREIAKFTGTMYNVLQIQNLGHLNKLSIADIQSADIIVVSCTLFKSESYLENLAGFAGSPDCPISEGRRYAHWLDETLQRLVTNTHILQNEGAQAVLNAIRDSELSHLTLAQATIAPSKRLKGTALKKATAESNKTKRKGDKSDSDDCDDSELDSKRSKATPKPKKSRATMDPWLLKNKASKDWRWMRSPPLDMFYFNRIVVDEFTYLKGSIHMGIINLKSKNKWVLSGTPPLGDFADIKSISVFLGIHLGIDDDTVGSKINNKKIASQRSAAETFQSFEQRRTAAWHHNRHSVAQAFLNKFVRQNVAEIDEIPFEEHIIPITLPAAERAIYLELEHHLMALDMKISKRGKPTESDRDQRLSESIGNSATAEEALLKKCSHFALDASLVAVGENAPKACDVIVKERDRQLKSNKKEVYEKLIESLLLYRQALQLSADADEKTTFKEFLIRQKRTINDPDGSTIVRDLIMKAETEISKNPKQRLQVVSVKKMEKDDSEEPDEVQQKAPSKDQALLDVIYELKIRQSQLVRLTKELMGRVRSLRYFKVVRDMQQNRLNGEAHSVLDIECVGCGRKELPIDEVAVSSGCGHLGCFRCLKEKAFNDDACPLRSQGCEYAARSSNIVKVVSLGIEEEKDKKGKHYGVKLEQIIDHIQNIIPLTEKVIVFVQFSDLMDKVSEAFEENGINHIMIRGSSVQKSKSLEIFQEGVDEKGPRVLLLNVTDESASGANLTNANHVIFISPLLTDSLQIYKANETQAIGRVRRYGQVKKIHIYRFLTFDSIDVKIYEERTGQKVKEPHV